MKLEDWIKQERGRAATLAKVIGVPQSFVSLISTGAKQAPAERCAPIEQATAGQVTRRDLRPADWGAIWPELISAVHPWPPAPGVIKITGAVPIGIVDAGKAFAEIDLGALPLHAANDSVDVQPLGRA